MLVLSRHRESTIQIGAAITITVMEIRKGRVVLGIHAPRELVVLRGELSPKPVAGIPCPPPLLFEDR